MEETFQKYSEGKRVKWVSVGCSEPIQDSGRFPVPSEIPLDITALLLQPEETNSSPFSIKAETGEVFSLQTLPPIITFFFSRKGLGNILKNVCDRSKWSGRSWDICISFNSLSFGAQIPMSFCLCVVPHCMKQRKSLSAVKYSHLWGKGLSQIWQGRTDSYLQTFLFRAQIIPWLHDFMYLFLPQNGSGEISFNFPGRDWFS